jgi:Uma2 family endonuclease
MTPTLVPKTKIIYPETDGMPMAENTIQFRWIQTIHGGLAMQYRDEQNIFVAADLFVYPVEGDPAIRVAPDILVAFGRQAGDRRSYLVWEEGGIFPQVIFEILSPGNRRAEMDQKWDFYDNYGAEEYYVYDPDRVDLSIWRRERGRLRVVSDIARWVSPLTGIQFNMTGPELVVFGANGQPFVNYVELSRERDAERANAKAANRRADDLEKEVARLRAMIQPKPGANGS